jgi:hypothetical protein
VTARLRIDWRDERGQVGGIEVLPFGLLVLVATTLVIANAWAVLDAKLAVTAASREAVRAYVEAPAGAPVASIARERAVATLESYGRGDPNRTEVIVSPETSPGRCGRVFVEVRHRVPVLTVPFAGGLGRGITARSVHTEIVDPFRDGLPAGACE